MSTITLKCATEININITVILNRKRTMGSNKYQCRINEYPDCKFEKK